MVEIDYEDPLVFEDEVRRISRILWPAAEFSGATMKAGRERDGVFETEECLHLVEATASRKKAKAEEDIIKLVSLYKLQSKRNIQKPIQCWFITRVEPTADQRSVVSSYEKKEKIKINCLSFTQFQSKLINARHYISARDNYWFGSVHDPRDYSNNPNIRYVPLDLIDEKNSTWKLHEISDKIEKGGRLVILGDYGAGKSMTLREVYRLLKDKYLKGQSVRFPIYINLRDHQGQQYPDEILDRHARKIGFAPKDHLVRAWRAGYAYIMLDGFDEITTFGITGKWKKLSEARYRSMEPIRTFIRDTPKNTGLIIAGRSYFFDNKRERDKSLCSNHPFETLSLNDFTEDQINQYLVINGIVGIVPNWMPSRPLLIGTLLLKGILQESLNLGCAPEGYQCDPGYGWDILLNEIAYREAQIDPRLDPETLRTIFDRLATKSRESIDGLASLSQEEIVDVFIDVCEYQPDDQAMVLLQRLPGLGIGSDVEGTRKFIDEDFADACRAGDFVRFIKDPYNCDFNKFSQIECCLGNTGLKVSTYKLNSQDISEKPKFYSKRRFLSVSG